MKYLFVKINLLLIINFIYLIIYVISFEKPGRKNPKYKINDYFGSRYLSSYLSSTFLNDSPTIVSWSNGRYIHHKSSNNLFISNYHRSTIDYIQNENLKILVGKSNEPSFRNGDSENARFNRPRALVLYNETSFPNKKAIKYYPVLFNENKANQQSCIYATISNYSVCLNTSYTLEQLANSGDPYDINPYLVKLLKLDNETNDEDSEDDEYIFLFVTDSKNHCIRKIDLVNIEVTTFAGECTEEGFKDGPLGINRFNEPQGLGIDSVGNLYVYDAGNRYIRLISPEGYVKTLVQGACFEYKFGEDIKNSYNYKGQYLLCFKNWTKTSGEPIEHIYYSNDEEYCYENIVNCPNYLSDQKRKNK